MALTLRGEIEGPAKRGGLGTAPLRSLRRWIDQRQLALERLVPRRDARAAEGVLAGCDGARLEFALVGLIGAVSVGLVTI